MLIIESCRKKGIGKPDEGEPHVRFDEGALGSPQRTSALLYYGRSGGQMDEAGSTGIGNGRNERSPWACGYMLGSGDFLFIVQKQPPEIGGLTD